MICPATLRNTFIGISICFLSTLNPISDGGATDGPPSLIIFKVFFWGPNGHTFIIIGLVEGFKPFLTKKFYCPDWYIFISWFCLRFEPEIIKSINNEMQNLLGGLEITNPPLAPPPLKKPIVLEILNFQQHLQNLQKVAF